MKKIITRLLIVCVISLFIGATVVYAAKPKGEAGSKEEMKEVDVVLVHDKGGNPNFQPYFEETGQRTKEEIGVGITPTPYPTTDVFIASVRAALPTEKAPGLFTWWSTYRMKGLIDQGLLADLTDVWDRHSAEYSQGLRDAFTFDEKNYGFVYGVEYWPVWYNKDVFARLNLEEPETWDEFIAVCDTLKKNGITPLFITVQARWPTFIMFEEMIIGEDPGLYVDLCEGKAKYTDPRVKKAFKVWADLIAKGYFTDPSTDLFADSPRLFNQDKLGMVVCGTWYYTSVLTANGVPEEKIGAFILPSHNPKAGKVIILEAMPILVSENSPNKDAAKKVADWLMGPEGNAFLAKKITSFPANQKSKADYLPPVKVNLMKTIVDENYQIMNRYWEATPTPICETAVDKFAEFILNPASANKVLADLDKIADEYWAQNK